MEVASSPVFERVPSGKIITETFESSRSRDATRADDREPASLRVSGMSRASFIIQPTSGILRISTFDIHFISVGRWEISRMSTKLSWFDTTTYGRRMSSGRSPEVRNFHSGVSLWCTTVSLRNRYPAA